MTDLIDRLQWLLDQDEASSLFDIRRTIIVEIIDALRAAEDRGIAMGLRAAAAWASDEANKCDDAAKWGGHRTYVANCKAAAYALRNAVLKIGGIKTDEARKIGGGE